MTYVKHISHDHLDAHGYTPSVDCATVSIKTVEAGIRRLDSKTYTALYMEGEGASKLSIGGGPDAYVVMFLGDEEEQSSWMLVGDANASGEATLIVGGQDGEFPQAWIVDFDAAVQAAAFFLESGEMDPWLTWERG